jgi:cell division septal protein FtsQ
LAGAANYLGQTYPGIASISIKRKLPDTVSAVIEERKPAAILNGSYVVDKEGIAFEISSQADLPKITDSRVKDVKLGEKAIDKMDDILKIIKRIQTQQITLVSDKRLDIKTADGINAYFSLEKDVDWQAEQLQTLLQEKIPPKERKDIEYIDLRYDKIFVKKAS